MLPAQPSLNQNDGENNSVLFFGRTLSEYIKIFDLDLSLWKGSKILDCAAEPASFVAEANKLGIHAVGCDPLYAKDLELLIEQGRFDLERNIKFLSGFGDSISNNFYPSIDVRKEYTTLALDKFIEDYPKGVEENRYIAAELPKLPFDTESFDLVLSSHLLFSYSKIINKLDYQFHLDSILELFRVSKREVKIYPIQGSKNVLNEYVENLLIDLKKQGIIAELVPLSYKFTQECSLILRLNH
ncbi:class I SAM-dependent methyltransferase [Nostoc sp.]|uniref:class I SAM-dependent methyltransferase n=1 Tax=Nostoc sp. TaxID=1180 RepID=UPI002FF6E44E